MFMALVSLFNLQSKTRDELMGLYSQLFNQTANKHIRKQQHDKLLGLLQQLTSEISAFEWHIQ